MGTIVTLFVVGCGGDSSSTSSTSSSSHAQSTSRAPQAKPRQGPDPQYCAHNRDPKCASGSYLGPFVSLAAGGGHWDANGAPVNGGPVGADGSTGNDLTQEFCAGNEDPACPIGSFVAANAIRNPDGSHTYVVCEGTVCTNPNHGGAVPAGTWDPDGNPVDGGPVGADGSTGNNLTHEYCARNEDPGCPMGSYVAPDAIQNPDGSNGYVTCEGTVCTNPNHGGADLPESVDPPAEATPDIDVSPEGDGDAGVSDDGGAGSDG
ncbi:hypothetical protein M1247_35500 [Mycobacterium sp. 21AC1]|nr:hypothetical protein [Mycobacterium sp. 21AC1]MDV3130256.1 hypothetical protein [Mycobacterium sp. 21AC1]